MTKPLDNSKLRTSYIGLGSNLHSRAGSPAETVTAAISRLSALGAIDGVSSFYKTEPVGLEDQPPFTNAAMALRTRLAPEALLEELLAVEREFGRDRSITVPKGPRTLDLDILMVDELVLVSPLLTIPHPALPERRFVLAPLAEIAANAIHPISGCTIAELLTRLPDTGENRREAVKAISVDLTAEKS